MAKELHDLSLKERKRVFEDIHGVCDVPEEEPEFVDRCMAELDEQPAKIRSNREAYDLGMELNPSLVLDRQFRLMFLRSECFNPQKAANRLINHFKFKLGLFREAKLGKRITLDDLDQAS